MKNGLTTYRKKRDFKKTPEPGGAGAKSLRSVVTSTKSKGEALRRPHALRFVVQKHRARQLHYDFRLAWGGVLKSWAVPKGPPRRAGEERLAVMVEDHPLAYASFSGTIPKGEYGAGTVEIWDSGTYEPVKAMQSGLRKGHVTVVLRGQKLKGEYALIRFRGPKNWLMIKAKKKI